MPLLAEYRWLRGFRAASASFSTAMSGDGMSGLPNPRSITSTPARREASLSWSMIVKTYGGRSLMRRKSNASIVKAYARRFSRTQLYRVYRSCMAGDPTMTRYALSSDGVHIAYQTAGVGDVDVVYVPGWYSHVEAQWEHPLMAH